MQVTSQPGAEFAVVSSELVHDAGVAAPLAVTGVLDHLFYLAEVSFDDETDGQVSPVVDLVLGGGGVAVVDELGQGVGTLHGHCFRFGVVVTVGHVLSKTFGPPNYFVASAGTEPSGQVESSVEVVDVLVSQVPNFGGVWGVAGFVAQEVWNVSWGVWGPFQVDTSVVGVYVVEETWGVCLVVGVGVEHVDVELVVLVPWDWNSSGVQFVVEVCFFVS